MKKVLIISSSLRENSNSEALCRAFEKGARESGNEVEFLSLKGKTLQFCTGCLICVTTERCYLRDDADLIAGKMKEADVLVFGTPIYYYEMSGQLKTLLDRANPLYNSDYRFREVYLLSTAAEDEDSTPLRAESGLQGWIECFPKAELKGTLFCGGVDKAGEISPSSLEKAYEMGKKS